MYKLFYYPRNASWAPHLLLAEMGVDYELVLVDRKSNQHKSPDYLLLNPTGRIPTLSDGSLVIFESAAICLYLCDKHPDAGLIPSIDSPLRAKCYQWLMYLNATLQPELMVYFYPQKHTTGEQTALIKAAQESRVTDMFSFINDEIGGRDFLVGNSLTLCDCFLFMLAHWASGFAQPPLSFKNLGRYLRTLATRKAVISVCEIEGTRLDIYK